jgi:site-specific DNA-methyltransferase (adenine-specific)
MINITNEDNMELMARYPHNHFDLAIVDPEYGIGASKPSKKPNKAKQKNGNILNIKPVEYKQKDWDNKPAGDEYFNELLRVSKHQIIWGVNFYNRVFGSGRIIWDKVNGHSDQFDCEIAYNSLNDRSEIVRFMWAGMFQGLTIGKDIRKAQLQQGNKKLNETRIHITQKPVKLYEWLLINYAKQGDKILDTHGGSLSIALAVHNVNSKESMNLTLDVCELDKEYFDTGVKRYKNHTQQKTIFDL